MKFYSVTAIELAAVISITGYFVYNSSKEEHVEQCLSPGKFGASRSVPAKLFTSLAYYFFSRIGRVYVASCCYFHRDSFDNRVCARLDCDRCLQQLERS